MYSFVASNMRCIYLSLVTAGIRLFIFSIPQTFQQTVSPTFTVNSSIYIDSSKTVLATSAKTGDSLYWNIVGPNEYDHKPEKCVAYAGLEVSPTATQKTIIINGCTLDATLVTDFQTGGSGSEVSSTIYAFRFSSSPFVTLACVVRICPGGEVSCAFNCSGRRRREREKPTLDYSGYSTINTIKIERKETPISEAASFESQVLWLLVVMVLFKAI